MVATGSEIRAGGATIEVTASDMTDPGMARIEQKTRQRFKNMAADLKASTASAARADWADVGALGKEKAFGLPETSPDRSAMRREIADRTAARRAERATMEEQARAQTAIDDRIFELSRTRRAVELRDAARHYAALRAQHAGNTAMLAKIDQAYELERSAIMGRTGVRGLIGRGGFVRRGLSMAGASLSPELGMATSLMSGAGSGTLAAALPLAPLALLAGGLYACVKAVKDAEAAFKEFSQYSDQTLSMVQSVQSRVGPEDPLAGDRQMRADLEKQLEEARSRKTDRLHWYNPLSWTSGGLIEKSADEHKAADVGARQQAKDVFDAYMERKAAALEELKVIRELHDAEAARISLMDEGPAKLRAELAERQALARQEAAAKNYVTPGAVDMEALDRQQARDKYVLEAQIARRAAEETASDQRRLAEARINLTQTGYAREVSLLALNHQQELEEYRRAGRDVTTLLAAQQAEREGLKKNEAQRVAADEQQAQQALARTRIESIKDEYQRRVALINETYDREIEAARKAGDSQATLDAIEARRQEELSQAKAADDERRAERHRSIGQQIEDIGIEMSGKTGKDMEMAKLQAERRRALEDAAKGGYSTQDVAALFDAKAALIEHRYAKMGMQSTGGIFNAANIQALSGGTAADRTAKATEATAKGVNKLVEAAAAGKLVFA